MLLVHYNDLKADRAIGSDLALSMRRWLDDELRLHELSNLATQMSVATIVTNA